MQWMDYTIESMGPQGQAFCVRGDYPGEVMGVARDGSPRDHWLYKPGDVFIVNEHGWLVKTEELTAMMIKYKNEL